MSQLVIVNDERLIGDSLSMMPAITALRERWDGDAYLHMGNEAVRDLMRPIGCRRLDELPNGQSKAKVVRSSAMEAFKRHVRTLHMIQAHFEVLGLPVPALPVRAAIDVDQKAPEYDYVVSPWSISDDNHNKAWFVDKWATVFERLHEEGDGSGVSIAVVGGFDDDWPKEWQGLVEYEYGKPLSYVAGLLVNAREAAVTIDNGVSHLAFHAGCERHVLLYPACLPPQWVADVNAAYTIRSEPRLLTVNEVLRAIREVGTGTPATT